ncbi:MAG: imidazole glycerol phosphate synthase subunit HisH [Treponemataceae bacterium]|nr:imidazole glycerol phosphate synthase subunit HisH [Treponemataceae bacterium]
MIGIVDYNAGNIKSVERALDFLGASYIRSKNPAELKNADKIIFPGDGDAAYAMKQLRELGLDNFLHETAKCNIPILGICIGAQIIFDFSEEGNTECLGLIPGTIRHFSNLQNEQNANAENSALKIPHMGWNNVRYENDTCAILDGVPENSDFYFVHSYVIQPKEKSVVKGFAEYGVKVPAVVQSGNIFACQFHPEKSGEAGLRILRNFLEI